MITQSSDHSSPQNGAVNTFSSLRSISLQTQTLWFATSSGKVNQPSLHNSFFFFFFLWWWPWSSTHHLFIYYFPYGMFRTKYHKNKPLFILFFVFLFVFSKNNEEHTHTHTHAPQLCVVTFFYFGTHSRRLWGRSTSKTKEINKRWIVELSFYWRSYNTPGFISMWW